MTSLKVSIGHVDLVKLDGIGFILPSFADFLFQARIISCTANPRNGKTRMMVDMVKDLNEKGIPTYEDFHVAGNNCDKIVPGQLPIDYPDDGHYLASFSDIKEREFPKGSVLFLDELIKEFDNRLTMGKSEETKYRAKLTQAFMQIGKKHLRVVHAEQITRTIDWRIAYLSEMFLVPRPTAFKIVDNEVVNVEFDVTPVVNEGIFGFREMPHYYMDEERFWYYAFEYDSDEPVMDEAEKIEAREKKKKIALKELEEKNRQKNIERKTTNETSILAQAGAIKSRRDKQRLKELGQSDKFDQSIANAPDERNTTDDTDNRKPLVSGRFDGPIRNADQSDSNNYENISPRQWQPGRKIKPIFQPYSISDFGNNLTESQFYDFLRFVSIGAG